MKKCPKCKIDLIIIQDDTPHPYSWGGYRLYGCKKCGRTIYEHIDEETPKEKKSSMKKPWIRKPIYDPTHHHDSHLIN